MFLNPAAFNAHLNHMGQRFLYRKAVSCPCFNPHSGAAKPGCPHCGGKSWFWPGSPVPAVSGVASAKVQREWMQFGLFESGDVVLSIPSNSPMYEMGQFDRVVMLNSTDHFSMPMTRGQNDRFLIPIEKVTDVFWIDKQGEIVKGGIPKVAADGTLSWASGAPPAGTQYTIGGTRYSEYFCYGAYPNDRNEHKGAALPKRVVLRKFDLFGR